MSMENQNAKLIKASLESKVKRTFISLGSEGDFREDTGAPVDIITFHREFLGRNLGKAQIEAYQAVWGITGNVWDQRYHEMVLFIGMKGGKNFWSEGDLAYTVYFISCLRDPHQYFSKLTGKPEMFGYNKDKTFDIVNVSSVGEQQARRSFFDSAKRVLQNTKDPISGKNWFTKNTGLDINERFGNFTKNEIIFPTSHAGTGGIRLLSFNSTSIAPEGLHIIRFYYDEMSRADSKATYKEASALLDLGLNNTFASFPKNVGKVIAWSYPNDTDYDLTYERYILSKTQPQIFGRKYATWEFNPSLKEEDFKKPFEIDPIKANRIYKAYKGISRENLFQPHSYKLDQMVNPSISNKVTFRQSKIFRQTNAGEQSYTSAEIISIRGDNETRFFSFDASTVNDRFVILGGRVVTRDLLKIDYFVGDSQEIISTNKKLIVDVMIVLEPTKDSPIDYIGIGHIFAKLINAFPNTYSINSDHYQNEKLRQELVAKGIGSKNYSFSNSMQSKLYAILRATVFNNNIEICNDNHQLVIGNKTRNLSEALIWEAKKVTKDGQKIDHPKGGSKDIIDALVILSSDMINAEVNGSFEHFNIDTADEEQKDRMFKRYLESELELEREGFPRAKMIMEISKRLGISYDQGIKIAQFIQSEDSGYVFRGKNNFYATIRFNDEIAKHIGYENTSEYDPPECFY